METIKSDMGRWNSQNASLVAKHEADRSLIKGLYKLTMIIKDQFVAADKSRENQLASLVELGQLSARLQIQDEFDKQSICLVGSRE